MRASARQLFLREAVQRKSLDALAGERQRRMGRNLVGTRGNERRDRGSGGRSGGQSAGPVCDYL